MKYKVKRPIFPVILEYDPGELPDGFGAQANRLVGIFSLAYHFRLGYRHVPIKEIPKEELVGFPFSAEKYELTMNHIRAVTWFPNIEHFGKKKEIRIQIRSFGRRHFVKLIVIAIVKRLIQMRSTTISLCLPQGVTDLMPNILDYGSVQVRENMSRLGMLKNSTDVVVHFRGGLRVVDTKRPQLTSRYFDDALASISQSESDIPVIIHTDFFPTDFEEFRPGVRVQMFSDWVKANLSTKKYNIEVSHYAPILEAFADMANARVLIMSNSSLSYFAGLVNQNSVIWPHIHGHSKLSRWSFGPPLHSSHTFIDANHVPYLNWIDPNENLGA